MRHVCTVSGKDSLSVALLLRESHPELAVEYVWNDTGWELPEVHDWIGRVECYLGASIYRCGDDLTEIVSEQGLLPSRMRRFCTKYAKIFPIRDYLAGAEHTLYLGLRADENDRILGMTPSKNQTLSFPLKDVGFGLSEVWSLVSKTGLMPPLFTWQWMVDRVAELGGERLDIMPEWEWLQLFSGRSRPNCDRCFFQRQYEWIWLRETHPSRFQAACEMEEQHQALSTYRWLGKDVPLASIVDRASEIKERRARWILRYLAERSQFKFPFFDDNPFGATSCGLFCGK